MRLWKELPVGERIAITFVVVLAILFALALFGYLTGRWDEAGAAPAPPLSEVERDGRMKHTCITDDEARERLRALMFEALDAALKEQWQKNFTIWMTDNRGQPDRARVGVSQALRAHQIARQLAEEWMPPLCEKGVPPR